MKACSSTCAACGQYSRGLDPHHIIPRGHLNWRVCISNGIALCRKCHMLIEDAEKDESDIQLFSYRYPNQSLVYNLKPFLVKSRPRYDKGLEEDVLKAFMSSSLDLYQFTYSRSNPLAGTNQQLEEHCLLP